MKMTMTITKGVRDALGEDFEHTKYTASELVSRSMEKTDYRKYGIVQSLYRVVAMPENKALEICVMVNKEDSEAIVALQSEMPVIDPKDWAVVEGWKNEALWDQILGGR